MRLLLTALLVGQALLGSAVPSVLLGHTVVTGASSSGVEFFGGIPFAEPPVGPLRLQPPVLLTKLNTLTFNATKFGTACLQVDLPPSLVSEDCLHLNVFRPANVSENEKLPVLFWIFGGAFTLGDTSSYNATGLVLRGVARGTPVMFVSVNYRVGPLGFPQGAEAGTRKALNLGIKDQLAGLQWVQANIAAFGGDKDKVTIFGESAGGTSVAIHFLGTHIKGLARAAIAQSPAITPAFEPSRNQAAWLRFVSGVPECASLANTSSTFDCLRGNVSAESLLQGFSVSVSPLFTDLTYFPNIDGPGGVLPDVPSKLTNKERLPIMIGTNLDEGTFFIDQHLNSSSQMTQLLTSECAPSALGPHALADALNEILRLYPDITAIGAPFGTGNNTFGLSSQFKRAAAIFGDFIFEAPRRSLSTTMSNQKIPVFGYHFTDPSAISPLVRNFSAIAPGSLGVTHGSEIFYVLNQPLNTTPPAIALGEIMQDYWISFAASLNPNDGKGYKRPIWPTYTASEPKLLQLEGGNVTLVTDNFRASQMSFINSNPEVFHR